MLRIVIGEGSCGIAAGAGKVRAAIEALLAEHEPFQLGSTGCIGMCFLEPIVDIYEDKTLLRRLSRDNPNLETSIFNSVHAVCLDTMTGYKSKGVKHSFLENYND